MSWALKTLSSELDNEVMGLNSSASKPNSNMSTIDEHWGLNSQGTNRAAEHAKGMSDTVDERLNREDFIS